MIELPLHIALWVYSGVIVLGALILWVYTEVKVQRTQRVLERQNLWRCAYCAYVYLDAGSADFSQCPRCESINTRGDAPTPAAAAAREAAATKGEDADLPRRNPSKGKRKSARRRGPRKRG